MIQNRLVFLAVVDLDECRESRAALADDSCFLDHLEVGALLDLYESLRLLCIRLDDDAVICDFDDFACNAGMNVGTESCRSRDQLASLDLVAYCYDRSARLADSTLLK